MQAMPVRAAILLALSAMLSLGGCTTRPTDPEGLAAYRELNDPFEPTNRAIFQFNEVVDRAILRPVAIGYRAVLPRGVRTGVRNFLDNIRQPVIFLNSLLQAEWERAGDTSGRFLTNTFLGLGGVIDIATEAGVPKHYEDFGQTLAVWGVEPGPYLVIPFIGPSGMRDGVGLVINSVMDPFGLLGGNEIYGNYAEEGPWIVLGFDIIDWRSRNIETIDELRRASLDFYATIRSAYRQRRASEISNGRSDASPGLESLPPMIDFDSMDSPDSQEPASAPPAQQP